MYFFTEKIPPNTSKSNPVIKTLLMDYGVITSLIINIPRGVFALAGFQLYRGTTQILPRNLGVWFTGDNINRSYDTRIELISPPYELTVKYYNEDDTYDHTITLQFSFLKTLPKRGIVRIGQLIKEKY